MNRGSIYWINLEPSHPPEFGKVRPCLVISNTEQNQHLSTVVVVPISSKAPEIWRLRLKILIKNKDSFVVIPGIRQVAKQRLLDRISILSVSNLESIDDALRAYLGD